MCITLMMLILHNIKTQKFLLSKPCKNYKKFKTVESRPNTENGFHSILIKSLMTLNKSKLNFLIIKKQKESHKTYLISTNKKLILISKSHMKILSSIKLNVDFYNVY